MQSFHQLGAVLGAATGYEFACIATAPAYLGELPTPHFARFKPQCNSRTTSKSTDVQPLRLSLACRGGPPRAMTRQKGALRWPRTFTNA